MKPGKSAIMLSVFIVFSFASALLFAQDIKFIKRVMTSKEFGQFKAMMGVFEEGKNYNPIIDGHGTGLKPMTAAEWEQLRHQSILVDKIEFLHHQIYTTPPPSHDNSATNWFPPIGDQANEGSCTAWANGYYIKTFQEASEHGWDLSGATWSGGEPTPAYQDMIASVDFIYHQVNDGYDGGSTHGDVINLLEKIGCCSWEKMPYSDSDHTSWPDEDAWRQAPWHRSKTGYATMTVNSDNAVADLKQFLANGNLASISVNANLYRLLTSEDLWTTDNYKGIGLNHANTIVGYDDNFGPYAEGANSNVYGAFKVANSWGVGDSWEKDPDGFYWISYGCMKKWVIYCHFFENYINYDPQVIAVFQLDHNKRGECETTLGIGSINSPDGTKSFDDYSYNGGDKPFPGNKMIMDITELGTSDNYFLKIHDGGSSTTGSIDFFSIEVYGNGYASNPTSVSTSNDPPVQTIDGQDVYAQTAGQSIPSISINDVNAAEGDVGTTDFIFTVTLSTASNDEVQVDFSTTDGSAAAENDYVAKSGTLIFPVGGSLTQTISVQVNGDELVEADETFFVNLSNGINATIYDAQGQGTIENDDMELSLSINDIAKPEGDAGTTNFDFTVTLSQATSQEVSVDFATSDGTAVAGDDYVAVAGNLIFPVGGSLTQTVTVAVNGDQIFENNETFFVNLSNAVNATIADNQGQGTIENDDVEITVSIDDVSQAEGNYGATNFEFIVSLNEASGQEVQVDFATANGTAIAGDDYVATSGTVIFNAGGLLTQTITVQVNGDEDLEANESFFVNLSNAVNASIFDGQGQGIIENDDTGGGNFMHIKDVKVTKVTAFGRWTYGKVEVQIVDQNNNPVENAEVDGEWIEGVSGAETFTTGSDGWGTEQSGYGRNVNRYCFEVTNVTKPNWTYDTDANVENWACSDGSGGLNALPGSGANAKKIGDIEQELGENVVFSHPNPFNSSTTISFYLQEAGTVTVDIYNVLGKKIATVLDNHVAAGLNSVFWNGADANGSIVGAGYYFFKVRFPNGESLTRRMLMLK